MSQYEMTSDLVARTTENYRDAFVFQVKGVNYPESKTVRNQMIMLFTFSAN